MCQSFSVSLLCAAKCFELEQSVFKTCVIFPVCTVCVRKIFFVQKFLCIKHFACKSSIPSRCRIKTLGTIVEPRIWVLTWSLIKKPMCLSMWIFEQSRTPRWFQNRVLKWFPEPCVLDRFGMCKCLLRQLHKMREETEIGGNRKTRQSNFHFSLRARRQWLTPRISLITLLCHLPKLVVSSRRSSSRRSRSRALLEQQPQN